MRICSTQIRVGAETVKLPFKHEVNLRHLEARTMSPDSRLMALVYNDERSELGTNPTTAYYLTDFLMF